MSEISGDHIPGSSLLSRLREIASSSRKFQPFETYSFMVAGTFHLKGRMGEQGRGILRLKSEAKKAAKIRSYRTDRVDHLSYIDELLWLWERFASLGVLLEELRKNHAENQKLVLYTLAFHPNSGADGPEF